MKITKTKDIYIQYGIFIFSIILIYGLNKADKMEHISILQKNLTMLPLINALLNTLVFFLIIIGVIAIKRGHKILHSNIMKIALVISSLFLILFFLHVFASGAVKYGDINHDSVLSVEEKNAIQNTQFLYYFFLSTHILLATFCLPFIILVAYKGLIGDYIIHKKIARIIYPLWLYITFTGPLIYWILKESYTL
ncbi:MAG: DUF420 domain-containing protein [Chitinophagaceae bacterium]|nr:DUF420 domain-containing protein [Chitinophagaceae bacterium]